MTWTWYPSTKKGMKKNVNTFSQISHKVKIILDNQRTVTRYNTFGQISHKVKMILDNQRTVSRYTKVTKIQVINQ